MMVSLHMCPCYNYSSRQLLSIAPPLSVAGHGSCTMMAWLVVGCMGVGVQLYAVDSFDHLPHACNAGVIINCPRM